MTGLREAVPALRAIGCGAALSFALLLLYGPPGAVPVSGPGEAARTVVVLDPGHGGEDGGAVSPDGVPESGLNLDIARRTGDLLSLFGVPSRMTREDDVSIGDPSLPTIRARKASDIRRRVELVNGTEHAVLISIHQNSLPSSPVTHGAQVFYNRQEGGQALAARIQDALNEAVNVGNEKRPREIGKDIYLMRHVTVPAALAECGFLSNAPETANLQDAGYQKTLAAAIAAGYLRYAAVENGGTNAAENAFLLYRVRE